MIQTMRMVRAVLPALRSWNVDRGAGFTLIEVIAVMLIMTDNGLTSLLKTQAKFGGDISIAVGPVGSGVAREVTADIVSFSRSKGIYGGLNLDGTLVKVSEERNHKYYGRHASPTDKPAAPVWAGCKSTCRELWSEAPTT